MEAQLGKGWDSTIKLRVKAEGSGRGRRLRSLPEVREARRASREKERPESLFLSK